MNDTGLMETAEKPKARKHTRAKTQAEPPAAPKTSYRGADNPGNPHPVKLAGRAVKLEPNPLTKKQAKDVAAGKIRDPRLAGRKSRRPRKNQWVPA